MGAKIDVALHEAGHAVIALDEGIELGDFIRMSLNDGFCQFADSTRELAAADPSLWAGKVIKALLAGQIAQERHVTTEGFSILDDERDAWEEDNRRCHVIATEGLKLDEQSAAAEIDRLREIVKERIQQPRIRSAI
jgi:hypothetical protein